MQCPLSLHGLVAQGPSASYGRNQWCMYSYAKQDSTTFSPHVISVPSACRIIYLLSYSNKHFPWKRCVILNNKKVVFFFNMLWCWTRIAVHKHKQAQKNKQTDDDWFLADEDSRRLRDRFCIPVGGCRVRILMRRLYCTTTGRQSAYVYRQKQTDKPRKVRSKLKIDRRKSRQKVVVHTDQVKGFCLKDQLHRHIRDQWRRLLARGTLHSHCPQNHWDGQGERRCSGHTCNTHLHTFKVLVTQTALAPENNISLSLTLSLSLSLSVCAYVFLCLVLRFPRTFPLIPIPNI